MKMNKENMQREKVLPNKGVLFLGGHQNLINKLRQKYPKWVFMTDDDVKRTKSIKQETVFYFTKYGSHALMRYVYSMLPKDVRIHYVTATNIPMLIREMEDLYMGDMELVGLATAY